MNFNMNKDKKWQRVLYVVLSVLGVIAVGVIITLSGCGEKDMSSYSSETVESSKPAESTVSVVSTPLEEGTLSGVITDAGANNLSIEVDGVVYTFGTEGVEVTAGDAGVLVGGTAAVVYRGRLNAENAAQKVEVVSISVSDPEGWSPESEEANSVQERAQAVLDGMSIEEKVGQLFIARCPEYDAAEKVSQYHLGGYILFGRDFDGKTREEIVSNIASYQAAANVPMLIGVDEEGGTVTRVSDNPNLRAVPFWSPQDLYAEGGFDLIESDTKEKCELLSSLGINLNFAPVCDITQNPDDFMYDRSFGKSAEETSEFVSRVVSVMKAEGMGSVLKHFPGYGSNVDTHTGSAYDTRSYESFESCDFLPFEAGINAGADVVLVSHNIVECMDSAAPASLSPSVHEVLRNELGFEGVIVTDDLIMDGVMNYAGASEVAITAVLAGNDLLCCSDFETQVPAVLSAVQNGEISEERINESVLRVLKLKIALGLEV